MNHEIPDSTNQANSTRQPNRRQFLQTAGFAGLAGLTTAATSQTAVAAPSSSSNPGAISNFSNHIEAPGVFKENQEPPHVHTAVPFDSVSAARDANTPFTELETRLGDSSNFQLLNGDWDFAWYEKPADVPDSYTDIDWDTTPVPSCWQTQGYDQFVYLNTPLTWTGIDEATNTDPPAVPDDYNPVGTYRRTLSIPDDWDGRETFLHFEGVKQAFFVWIDDTYIGYNQGSMTATEFDITDDIASGSEHTLTVQVYRFSDGEALETQDMFRFSGIYRSVYLYSTSQVHLRDFFVRTDLDENYEDATLQVDAELANYTETNQGQHTLRGHLFDTDGSKVTTFEASESVGSQGTTLSANTTVTDPEKWSAEDPTLYTLVLEHVADGSTDEAMFEPVGFRELAIENDKIHVNGQPVNFRGVNSHEHHPDHGRHVPVETVRKDFELMKSHNVNALRCSHYPRDPSVYYLADEYGLYVQDELNVETHWNTTLLGQTDKWDAQALERFQRMVQCDKNRPCIFTWSTGNEAGLHDVHYDMAEYVKGDVTGNNDSKGKGVDPTRFLYHQANNGGVAPYAPIDGPRYPTPDAMKAKALGDGDPFIMGEYAHAMGNSGGLFHDFWKWAQPDHRTVTETIFPDQSSADNDGKLVGDSKIIEEDNGAVVFENNGYVTIGKDPSLDFTEPGFTLWARVKDDDTQNDDPYIARGDQQYALKIIPGDTVPTLQFFIYDRNNGWQTLNAPVPDDWTDGYHDVVGVATDSTLKLFVDGELIGEESHDAATLTPDDDYGYPVTVGYNAQKGRHTEASISQVRVYDRALSNSEVATAASATSPPTSAVLWIDFGQISKNQVLRQYDEYGRFQGGFVWDWVNQAVHRTTQVDGEMTEYRSYDGNPFCLNGVISANRVPQPSLEQLKKSHQPVGVTAADLVNGEVRITNHLHFANLSTLDATWELQADDEVIEEGSLSPDIAPDESTVVSVPFNKPDLKTGVEYWLTLRFKTTQATKWADTGHQLAFDQLKVPFDVPEPSMVQIDELSELSVSDDGGEVTVAGDDFEYVFSRNQGTLSSGTYSGTEVVSAGPLLDFFRAPIQNEIQSWGAAESNEWYDIGLDNLQHEVRSLEATQADDAVAHVAVESFVSGQGSDAGFDTRYRYKIFGSGDILLGVDVEPTQALVEAISHWLPRVGVAMDVPNTLNQFEWYGRGPHETYPDRKWGAEIDVHTGSVADQFVPYQPPSDNGNKTDTRWATLTNDDGVGLASFGQPELNVNLNQYRNLAEADHVYELDEKDGVTTVHLDHAVTGVGGTPVQTLPQYQVDVEPMTFLIRLRPFEGKRAGPPEHANNDGKKRQGPPDHANNDGEKRRGPPDHANDDVASPMKLSKQQFPRDWVNFQQGR
jgi:beta-galactosidase